MSESVDALRWSIGFLLAIVVFALFRVRDAILVIADALAEKKEKPPTTPESAK